jgi:calcineurin-like phosphoesterase family protein
VIWFTSDQHYGHTNIIAYMKRPFASVTEMNEEMIRRYQACVQPTDDVYIIGDLAFCDPTPIVNRLPGRKHLIRGNHDECKLSKLHRLPFAWIKETALVEIEGQYVFMSHYPHRSWPRKGPHIVWHLHGHSHGFFRTTADPGTLDVGVDCWDYAPVSWDAVKERLASYQPKSRDD